MSFTSLGGTLARLQSAVDEFFDGYFAGAPSFWNFFGRKQLCIFTDYITQGEVNTKYLVFRQYQVHVGYRHFWTEMSFLRNIFVTLFFNAMLLLSCYVLW